MENAPVAMIARLTTATMSKAPAVGANPTKEKAKAAENEEAIDLRLRGATPGTVPNPASQNNLLVANRHPAKRTGPFVEIG